MSLQNLGRTQIKISPIGLGCWQFSGGGLLVGGYWGAISQATVNAVVKTSLEHCVNWYDTAEAYGFGASEHALSTALQAAGIQPQDSLIATKWMPALRFASSLPSNTTARLKTLHPYPISLLQIHQPFSFSSIESQMRVLAGLLKDGRIRSVGVSNFNLPQVRRAAEALDAHGFPLASNQMPYSLLNRRIEQNGVLDHAKQNGITIIAYSPLAQGLLSGRYHDQPELVRSISGLRKFLPAFRAASLRRTQPLIDELKSIAHAHQKTPAQVALRWVIQFHGEAVVAIPGASHPQQAQENAAVLNFTLTAQELTRLDEVSRAVVLKS
jgi:aryl-alcohol dehydrogenase-like predicted oxidoreductase